MKACVKQKLFLIKVSGHKQGRENRRFGFKMARVLRGRPSGVPPTPGGTVYHHHFHSPFLFPTIEDDDDDSDQTKNPKKNAEDYQRVLVWRLRVRLI